MFSGARVTNSGSQALPAGNIPIAFDTETFDTDAYHNPADNTKLTVPATGFYFVGGALFFGGASTFAAVRIRLNGSTVICKEYPGVNAGTQLQQVNLATGCISLTTGDYLELLADTTGGASCDIQDGAPSFWIFRIG